MPDSAFVALQKAASLPKRTTYQEFTVNKGFGLYYIRTENFAEAKKRLEASEELFRRDPSLRFHTAGLSYLRTAYFKASGQYGKALETILETQRDTVIRSSGFNNYALTKELATSTGTCVRWSGPRPITGNTSVCRTRCATAKSALRRTIFREFSKSAACTTKPRSCSTTSSANACATPI